jgi:hypothetical protein
MSIIGCVICIRATEGEVSPSFCITESSIPAVALHWKSRFWVCRSEP